MELGGFLFLPVALPEVPGLDWFDEGTASSSSEPVGFDEVEGLTSGMD